MDDACFLVDCVTDLCSEGTDLCSGVTGLCSGSLIFVVCLFSGGGGNFGVVLSVTLVVVPAPAQITGAQPHVVQCQSTLRCIVYLLLLRSLRCYWILD